MERERWGKGYYIDGEAASIKCQSDCSSGYFYILSLLTSIESSVSVVAFLFYLTKKLSNINWYCFRCNIFLKCIIASSLKMYTALFANIVSG